MSKRFSFFHNKRHPAEMAEPEIARLLSNLATESRVSGYTQNRAPEISRFFGIVIKMLFDDHNPPHFHAEYGSDLALIDIRSLAVFSGRLPPRVTGLVIEWATLHQQELLADWDRARAREELQKIPPLE